LIVDPTNDIEVSPATYWEIAIKISLGKYALPEPYDIFIERKIAANDCRILPIEPKHTAVLTTLPFHHRDPFDRLLIAQAMVEAIPILSIDPVQMTREVENNTNLRTASPLRHVLPGLPAFFCHPSAV
jgi:PIN domain nuclease of toxin-antitoxin system